MYLTTFDGRGCFICLAWSPGSSGPPQPHGISGMQTYGHAQGRSSSRGTVAAFVLLGILHMERFPARVCTP